MAPMSFGKIIPLFVATTLLAGCADSNVGLNKQTGGAVLGGLGGGLLGAQFGRGSGNLAMTALGAVAGAFIGSEVGKSLDKVDQAAMQRAERHAETAPMGQSIAWSNPDSGHSGTVTPTRDGTDQSGNYCREYQSTVTVDSRDEKAFGTACRQPDGTWKVVK